MMIEATFVLFLFSLPILAWSDNGQPFDVRNHLSTVTRYGGAINATSNFFVPSQIPDQCSPIHLNIVARHGTRSPTKKRMRELDVLSSRLKHLAEQANVVGKPPKNVPAWLLDWESPWKLKRKGGELVTIGEDELYNLGIRVRERFPNLFSDPYHPDVYTIKATQVPRASASAVAFGMGLFSDKGTLGSGRNRAFAVISESRASDLMLRFFDSCETYKAYRAKQQPKVDILKEPILNEISQSLISRYGLNFTRNDAASLWFLCKQEACLMNVTHQACALFTPNEVELLEWTDDVEGFVLKGYGNAINYRMGVPLLKDIVESMEEAIKAKTEDALPGSYEKARLRFAHAETLVPLSCLLGLFLEGSDFERIKREETLELPPRPPLQRNWKGGNVAPFAGNNMLVLYTCEEGNQNQYFVQVLHNEQPVTLPGCNNKGLCPFEVFKDQIVAPHLKHDYNTICRGSYAPSRRKSLLSKVVDLFWGFIGGHKIREDL